MRNALVLAFFTFVIGFCIGWSWGSRPEESKAPAGGVGSTQFPVHGEANAPWNDPRIPAQTRWVTGVMMDIQTIKPGMTRQDLLKVFTTEGGLSTRTQQTYVHKDCPYVKVDVVFKPVGDGGATGMEGPRDEITRISQPYLQASIMD
jgi:hypothetical protein